MMALCCIQATAIISEMADHRSRDLLAEMQRNHEEIRSGKRQWGRWRYRPDIPNGHDDVDREQYYVSVKDCLTQHNRLDWIGQIADKPWPPEVVGDFVRALDDVVGLRWPDDELAKALRAMGEVN